jgi:hypothetical protein
VLEGDQPPRCVYTDDLRGGIAIDVAHREVIPPDEGVCRIGDREELVPIAPRDRPEAAGLARPSGISDEQHVCDGVPIEIDDQGRGRDLPEQRVDGG